MNEEERRIEILKAEAAIRELAGRMAEAIECTRQANMARSALETAARSMDQLVIECRALLESQKRAIQEGSESLSRARESLDIGANDLQSAQERLEEKNQEFYNLMDAKLDCLKLDIDNSQEQLINKVQEQLSEKAKHLETSIDERSHEYHELLDSKFGHLSWEIMFIMDQNEALIKRNLILEECIEELSGKFQEFGNDAACNLEDIQEIETKVLDYDERPSSMKQALETKAFGFSHRVRSAIIGGGLGVIIVLMIIRIV